VLPKFDQGRLVMKGVEFAVEWRQSWKGLLAEKELKMTFKIQKAELSTEKVKLEYQTELSANQPMAA
jgi:hypothetical protein